MKKILIIFYILSPVTGLTQCENLFQNAGLEQKGPLVGPNIPDDFSQAQKADHWTDDLNKVGCFGGGTLNCYHYHSPDWIDNDGVELYYHTYYPTDPEDCGGYLSASEGGRYFGMASGELVEQNFALGNELQAGQNYVISMDIHILRTLVLSSEEGGHAVLSIPLSWTWPNPHLKILIGKNKIKYDDNQSWDYEKDLGGTQDIIEVMDWEFDMTNPLDFCNWQTIQGSFTAPSNAGSYDWIAIEVQEDADESRMYLAIDNVNLTQGCLLSCSPVSGPMPNYYAANNLVSATDAVHIMGLDNVTEATINVYTVASALVYSQTVSCTNGLTEGVYWYGKTVSGSHVANANYFVEIEAKNDCGELCTKENWMMINKTGNYAGTTHVYDCYQGEIKTPEACCPLAPDIYLDRITFDGPGLLSYKALNNIYCSLTAPDDFLPVSQVELRAGNEIYIGPGVTIQNGADFHAVIEPCTRSASNTIAGNTVIDYQPVHLTAKAAGFSDPENDLEVYPNPSTGKFKISMRNGIEHCNLKVINPQGEILFKKTGVDFSDKRDYEIDLNSAARGIYFVEIVEPTGKTYYKRIIVQ